MVKYKTKRFNLEDYVKDQECRELLEKTNKLHYLHMLPYEDYQVDAKWQNLDIWSLEYSTICGLELEWNSNLYITNSGDVGYNTKHFLSHKIDKYSFHLPDNAPTFYICFSKNMKHVAICKMEDMFPFLPNTKRIRTKKGEEVDVVEIPNSMVIFAKIEDWAIVVDELLKGNFPIEYDVTKFF